MKNISYITIIHGVLLILSTIGSILKKNNYGVSKVHTLGSFYLVYFIWIIIGIIFIFTGIDSLKQRKYSYFLSLGLYGLIEIGLIIEFRVILANEFSLGMLLFGGILIIIYFMILIYIKRHRDYYVSD